MHDLFCLKQGIFKLNKLEVNVNLNCYLFLVAGSTVLGQRSGREEQTIV